MSDPFTIKWRIDPLVVAPPRDRMVKVVYESNPGSESWLMRMKDMVSAWGDHDTPDHVGLSSRETVIKGKTYATGGHVNGVSESEHIERERLRIERAVEAAKFDALIEAAKVKDREAAALAEANALDEFLEATPGAGSF